MTSSCKASPGKHSRAILNLFSIAKTTRLRNSKDEFSKTGYALGLGCLHRYLGSMGAGQHMTSSLSILFALAQNSSSSIVQVWAIHALYLITDSGGSMFRNYIEPCVEFIVQSVLSISYTSRDVFVGLGKMVLKYFNVLVWFTDRMSA